MPVILLPFVPESGLKKRNPANESEDTGSHLELVSEGWSALCGSFQKSVIDPNRVGLSVHGQPQKGILETEGSQSSYQPPILLVALFHAGNKDAVEAHRLLRSGAGGVLTDQESHQPLTLVPKPT